MASPTPDRPDHFKAAERGMHYAQQSARHENRGIVMAINGLTHATLALVEAVRAIGGELTRGRS